MISNPKIYIIDGSGSGKSTLARGRPQSPGWRTTIWTAWSGQLCHRRESSGLTRSP